MFWNPGIRSDPWSGDPLGLAARDVYGDQRSASWLDPDGPAWDETFGRLGRLHPSRRISEPAAPFPGQLKPQGSELTGIMEAFKQRRRKERMARLEEMFQSVGRGLRGSATGGLPWEQRLSGLPSGQFINAARGVWG